jgi:hypothetical protein
MFLCFEQDLWIDSVGYRTADKSSPIGGGLWSWASTPRGFSVSNGKLDTIRITHTDISVPEAKPNHAASYHQVPLFGSETGNKLISDMLILLWD